MKWKHVSLLRASLSTFSYSVSQHPGVKQWHWVPWGIISGFPGGASGKEPICQCRRLKRRRFDPGSGRSPGEGNGNPLQYSCLENPVDSGAWQAVIHRVTQSWTLLKWLSTPHPGTSWSIQNWTVGFAYLMLVGWSVIRGSLVTNFRNQFFDVSKVKCITKILEAHRMDRRLGISFESR